MKQMNKIIMYILMLMLSISIVNAGNLSTPISYYSFDTDANDDYGSNNGVLSSSGMTHITTGQLLGNGAYDFSGTNSYIDLSAIIPFDFGTSSISLWVKADNNYGTRTESIFSAWMGVNSRFHLQPYGNGNCYFYQDDAGLWSDYTMSCNAYTNGAYNHIVVTSAGLSTKLYIDNTLVTDLSLTKELLNLINTRFYLGASADTSAGVNWFDGQMDEVAIYNFELNTSQISTLYNSGAGYNPLSTPTLTPTISIDNISLVNNSYHNSNIDIQLNLTNTSTNSNINSSYSLNGGSYIQFGTNTLQPNLTLSGLSNQLYNITFKVENNETQTNSSYYYFIFDNINPSVEVITNQTEFNTFQINMSEIFNYSDTNLDTCEIYLTELENVSVNDSDTFDCDTLYNFSTAGLHNLRINATDLAGNYNDTTEWNITIANEIRIIFNDTNLNATITDYNVTIYHPDGRVVDTDDGGLGYILLSPVNNGELDLGVHTIEFDKVGYLLANVTINVTENSSNQNITFNVPGAKILINVYDILDYEIINTTTTTIEIIGDSFSNIYTTSTGYLNITSLFLIEDTYNLIVSNADYETATYSFNFNNQELLEFNVYLTPLEANESIIADIIVSGVDDYQNPLKNFNIIQYVWDSGRGEYVQTNLKATDYNGQTSFKVFLNTKLYNFCLDYFGTLYCETDLSININTQEIVIEVPVSKIALPGEETIHDIDFPFSLLDTDLGTNFSSVVFSYSNPNQDVDQYCLKIYTIQNLKRILSANQCSVSHTSALSVNVPNNTSTSYVAVATIQVGTDVREIDELTLFGVTDLQDQLASYGLVKLILVALVSLIVGIAIHKKVHDIRIAHFGLPIIFLACSILFDEYISAESFVLVLLVNLMAWKITTKKDDLNKEAGYTTLTSILMLYMIFIFGLHVALTEMDSKGLLDEYGTNILNNIDDENSYFDTYVDTATDSLKSKQANGNVGAWELLTAIFLKTLEFVDMFFSILANLFNIISNMILILGIKNSLLLQIAKVLDFGIVGGVIYLYFKEAFK